MMRSFSRWMREVLPPGWVIAIALLFYLVPEAWYIWWEWWVGIPEAGEPMLRIRDVGVAVVCVAYGLFRVWAFHPAFRPRYRQWLSLTPWTSEKPLPLGPIHLVAQDLVVLAVACLLLHDSPFRLLLPPAAFLGAYLAAVCASLLVTDVWKIGYFLAFGLGLAARLANQPVATLCVLATLYPLAYFGLRRSLACFPWQTPEWLENLSADRRSSQRETATSTLGWPYDHLHVDLSKRPIPRKHAVLTSLLAGWYLYELAPLMPRHDRPEVLGLIFLGCVLLCVVGRTLTYCALHWPPISLWGRIRTFRWIIPGYDQVLVAPLCSLLVAAAFSAAYELQLPPRIVVPTASSLVLLITLNMGPSLQSWRLTGNHRIAPGVRTEMFHRL